MYHRILKLYEDSFNIIMRATAAVLYTLPNSPDPVEDASPVAIVPAGPTCPGQLQTNNPLNSSGTAVVGSKIVETLMN